MSNARTPQNRNRTATPLICQAGTIPRATPMRQGLSLLAQTTSPIELRGARPFAVGPVGFPTVLLLWPGIHGNHPLPNRPIQASKSHNAASTYRHCC